MHFSQKLGSLAIISLILCIAIMGTSGQEKKSMCCTMASTENITATITGFQLQKRNPPCIKAVIFYTAKGSKCSHWKESWVIEKVRELRKLQVSMKEMKLNSTTVVPQTTGSS